MKLPTADGPAANVEAERDSFLLGLAKRNLNRR
ncbi:hypothetical protein ACVIYL_000672 [Bradyrhizobium sp. USDA 3315]